MLQRYELPSGPVPGVILGSLPGFAYKMTGGGEDGGGGGGNPNKKKTAKKAAKKPAKKK